VINKCSIIERQIRHLLQAGISEIHIVVGYRHELFTYLEQKYKVHLIYNPYYKEFNNVYSMFLARHHLGDSYVLEGDVYLNKNVFFARLSCSTYFTALKEVYNSEWVLDFTGDKLDAILLPNNLDSQSNVFCERRYIMSGMSYWNRPDSAVIRSELETIAGGDLNDNRLKNWYWDHIVLNHLNLFEIKIQKMNPDDWWEIDNYSDLIGALNKFQKAVINYPQGINL
jgi:CTP:phosphocholine cytidylyltransferase-like protein